MVNHLNDSWNRWYQIEPRLAEYENFALSVMKNAGYSTREELEDVDFSVQVPETVKIALRIFDRVASVRQKIKGGNPEEVALEMMLLCSQAFLVDFSIKEPALIKGQNYTKHQSAIAKKPRTPADLNSIIERLAKYKDHTPKELWPEFYSMLSNADMNPREEGKKRDSKTWRIEYFPEGKNPRSLKFTTFRNRISQERKKISR